MPSQGVVLVRHTGQYTSNDPVYACTLYGMRSYTHSSPIMRLLQSGPGAAAQKRVLSSLCRLQGITNSAYLYTA